jgi:hypothetical protein
MPNESPESAMSNIIEVQVRNVYGNTLVYPANELARKFATLLGVKTFNRSQVLAMKDLGYVVGQVIGELAV